MLLVFLVPAFLYWLQHQPRVIGLDVFMLLYIFWIAVAIYHNHGMSRMVYIINQTVTLLGSYMLGRVLVRNADDYRRMFTILFWIMVFLFPFALVELVLKLNLLGKIFGLPGSSGSGPGGIRLGMRRVSSVFPHPILFGVFCSIMVSNFFYVFSERTDHPAPPDAPRLHHDLHVALDRAQPGAAGPADPDVLGAAVPLLRHQVVRAGGDRGHPAQHRPAVLPGRPLRLPGRAPRLQRADRLGPARDPRLRQRDGAEAPALRPRAQPAGPTGPGGGSPRSTTSGW